MRRDKNQLQEVMREGLLEMSIKIVEGMENMTLTSGSVFLMIRRLMVSRKQRKYFFIQVAIKLWNFLFQDTVAIRSINWLKKGLSAMFVG